MKKILTILTVVGFLATSVNAQKGDAGIKFGAKAGINLASETVSDGILNTTGSRVGVNVGGFITIPLGNGSFALQPELAYLGMGGKFTSSRVEMTQNFDYLSVPVLVKYSFEKVGVSGLSALAGPQIDFLLSAKNKYSDGSPDWDNKDQYNSTNFSGVIGAEYALPMGINFSARYMTGLSNIAKNNLNTTAKLSGLTIAVGYTF